MTPFGLLFASLFLALSTVTASPTLPQHTSIRRKSFAPSGANYSPCVDQSQCTGNRDCLALVSVTAPARCTHGKYCACVPRGEGSWRCPADGACDQSETCVPAPDIFPAGRVCVDNSQIDTVTDVLFCKEHSECEPSGRICVTLEDGLGACAAPPPPLPKESVESEALDVAATSEEEPMGDVGIADDDQQPSLTTCIAAHHLHAYRKDNALLYRNDVPAYVLCDADNNCATDGHMVLFRGRAMMMKSYCATVRCERALMKVNSLRYRRAAVVASNSHDLHFSAFSARYGSGVEEVVLGGAMRLGF